MKYETKSYFCSTIRAVSYNTEHLFQTIFPHDRYSHWLTIPTKAYTMNINHIHEEFFFLKSESRHTHLFILQTVWWIFYEVWRSVTSMQETPKEVWVSALQFPLLWFTSHSSKLTFTCMRNRTDCGHTYPQEICDLYGNNLYYVSYICLCYLKEKRFSAIHVLLICFVFGDAKKRGG